MNPAYLNAIQDHGGIGVLLAHTDDPEKWNLYRDMFDGFLFAGGVDVDPKYYGEAVAFDSVEIDEQRDTFEFGLFSAVIQTGKPILGICRGEQMLNVAMGGSLYQHIDGHQQTEKSSVCPQRVSVKEGTRLREILGTAGITTNSFHHQAVKEVAPSLIASAYAADGTVEAVESATHPFLLAVQWHPELFYRNSIEAQRLFSAFITAASANEAP